MKEFIVKYWRLLVLSLLIVGISSLASVAAPPVEVDGNVSIASGSNFVPFDGGTGARLCKHWMIWTDSGASTIYITFNPGATATTSNAKLVGGATINNPNSQDMPAVGGFTYDGTGTTGAISWIAW